MALNNERDWEAFVNKMAQGVGADTWRAKTLEDSSTAKWYHLFEKMEPDKRLVDITIRMVRGTGGQYASDWIYTMLLAAWTYGLATAFDKLASEEIMLFEGVPLDFPDWNAVPKKIDPPEDECVGCFTETENSALHRAGCEFHKTGMLPSIRKAKEVEKKEEPKVEPKQSYYDQWWGIE